MLELKNINKDFVVKDDKNSLKNPFLDYFFGKKMAKRVIHDVNFKINEGEIVGYIGTNGAGKSTTIKMMCGILQPTEGEILLNGHSLLDDRRKYNKQMGVVFGQKTHLWWDLPLKETFKVLKEIYKIDDISYENRIKELTELLDLEDFVKTPVRALSLGQRMRADLAAAFLHSPKLLFLDEPMIGLDIVVKEKIRDFLAHINKTYKTTIVFTSHDFHEIEFLCKRIIIIDMGKITFDGNIQELRKKIPYQKRVNVKIKNTDLLMIENIVGDFNMDKENNFVSFNTKDDVDTTQKIGEIFEKFLVEDITIENINLEDILKLLWK